jgi:NAD(P)-dependent dehydrogenase (short-subunit alcohol dehydrogenase family)/acyl carrier protein
LAEPEEAVQAKLFRDRGVYLITGGWGRIGLVLAEFLAKQVKARLILTGRSFFPARDQWDQWLADHDEADPISGKIRKVRELEVVGADVMIFCADAGNPEQMQEAVAHAETHFGPVNGVIHCAGIIEGKSIEAIDKIARYQCQEQFQAKIYGLLVLERIFQGKTLDFCWVMSSIASVLGGLGFVAYAAANSYMNAFVNRHDRLQGINSTPWISVNWDGMEPEAAVSAFRRILALEDVKQVIVSTGGGLQERINRWVKLESLRQDKEEDVLTGEAASFYPRPDLTGPYVAASKPHEQRLVNMWQKLFGFEQIGIRDNFFELGGDSLKAIIVISRIHRELNVEVPIAEFFNRPTIEDLVQYIETADQSSYLAVEPAEDKEYYPLSAAQKRFYILHQVDLDSTAYCMPLMVRLDGQLDVERLKQAFLKLIQRHESLRTSFELIDGVPCQRVYETVGFSVNYSEAPESEARKLMANFVKPFDLTRAPLLRMGLVKLEEEKHLLMLTMDHIISDGVSLVIFIKDLIALY